MGQVFDNPISGPASAGREVQSRPSALRILPSAGKPALPPNYLHFCKSAFLGAKPLLPGLYKAFFAVTTAVFRPAFCTHGGKGLFQTCAIIAP
jgi:hypothetical protein